MGSKGCVSIWPKDGGRTQDQADDARLQDREGQTGQGVDQDLANYRQTKERRIYEFGAQEN